MRMTIRWGLWLAAGVLGFKVWAADDPRALLRDGTAAYEKEKYEDALRLFNEAAQGAGPAKQDPAVPAYNAGNALMRLDRREEAAKRYIEALRSTDLSLQSRASFNRGNALYQLAEEEQRGGQLDVAAKAIGEAVQMYERAVLLDARDTDAKVNYELALWKKQQIEQQVQQQQQQERKSRQEQSDQKQAAGQQQPENQQETAKPASQEPPEAGQEQPGAAPRQPEKAEAMTPEEARMLLDRMKQEEQAYREQLRVIMGAPVPVEKDW